MGRSEYHDLHCPSCGNDSLPEFFVPVGMALCARCGTFLRRSSRGLIPVGVCPESLLRIINERMRGDDIVRKQIQEGITQVVADQLGIAQALIRPSSDFIDELGIDSLDAVELVMALEEEFGIELDMR